MIEAVEVEWCDLVDSTNERLLRRPWTVVADPAPVAAFGDAGAAPFRVSALAAREQHAGRGRRQRVWFGEPGMALLLSVAIDRPRPTWPAALSGFSIACANAVIDALESAKVAGQSVEPLRIKWPNDLVRLRRRASTPSAPAGGAEGASGGANRDIWLEKVAGLLIETRQTVDQSRIVIGLGLNLCRPLQGVTTDPCERGVSQRQADLAWACPEPERVETIPGGLPGETERVETIPGGLLDETARDSVDAQVLHELAHRIAQCQQRAWLDFEHSGLASFRAGIGRRDVLRGEWVEIEDDTQGHRTPAQGCVVGIDDSGHLLVSPFSSVQPTGVAGKQGSMAALCEAGLDGEVSKAGVAHDPGIPVAGSDSCFPGLMRYCGASVRLLQRKSGPGTLPGARR